MVQVNGLNKVVDSFKKNGGSPEDQAVVERIQQLQAQLAELKEKKGDEVKKNQRPGKAAAGRKYVLLSKKLASWGKVPQQQADIADLMGKHMEVGKEYTEAEVFDLLVDQSGDYPSLTRSVQDPTYLFRYYRGLKPTATHGGFVARNFVRVIG